MLKEDIRHNGPERERWISNYKESIHLMNWGRSRINIFSETVKVKEENISDIKAPRKQFVLLKNTRTSMEIQNRTRQKSCRGGCQANKVSTKASTYWSVRKAFKMSSTQCGLPLQRNRSAMTDKKFLILRSWKKISARRAIVSRMFRNDFPMLIIIAEVPKLKL